jgi:hypothetical protein
MRALRAAWENKPFGQVVAIPYRAVFSADEVARLTQGLVPQAMEDKWFIYYEPPHLFFHRSWTGDPAYRVTLEVTADGASVVEAVCAKNAAKTVESDYQAQLLDFLVSNLLLGQRKPFPRPAGSEAVARGVRQHGYAGTGYPEMHVKAKRAWWRFW